MLEKFRFGACALAASTTLWATAAQAQIHSVLIMDGSYFPSIIYVQTGDAVVFTNLSSDTHVVSGPEGSWTSGPIAIDATYQLTLTDSTPLQFGGEGPIDPDTGSPASVMAGEISYDPAPLQD